MAKENAVAVVERGISIEAVIQNAIDKGVPVETMERLMAMRRELKAEAAKTAYDSAMSAFQAECPTIKKTKAGGKTRGGIVAYYYAPLESIVEQVKVLLQKHGFSYGFDTVTTEGMVKAICIAKHELGHSESTSFEVPLGTKTEIMSATQVTAAAITYAKRYAFCNAFGILTGDEDTDAAPQERMEPYKVTRVTKADEDEAQGKRSSSILTYDYPPHNETNDAHSLDVDKPEPDKDTQIILELLKELGKPAETPRIAKMNVKILTGGLKSGLTWEVGTNNEEVIDALRTLNVERMNHGK